MANQVLIDLRNALEPRHPYYALRFATDCDDVDVTVYNPDTHNASFECAVTLSFALAMLEGAAHLSIDGDHAEFEEITARFKL